MTASSSNHLSKEQSPYLLQHADNPVDWYPWNDEAFARAKMENKPIFLSIGYSTCHWCHVMERESFEDPEVAALLNKTFVCIKVDREEHPDLDHVYMTVCQMLTGGGGWPLTIVMTPDKQPFFAGTYLPKNSAYGRVGMMELIPQIASIWKKQRTEVMNSAARITASLQRLADNHPDTTDNKLNTATLEFAFNQLRHNFDEVNGGFGAQPKFPTPHNLLFLLRYGKRTGDPEALRMVEKTLQKMRQGGIYDQIGFGFHRYSTDAAWLVPHFEKMLYDQAMLAMAYTEAFQATGKAEYRDTAEEIFTYVLRDMTSSAGGFYSAEDADSEGKEGKYYLWTETEIRDVLGDADTDIIIRAFDIRAGGNFTDPVTGQNDGVNILHLAKSPPEIAADLGVSVKSLERILSRARQKLFLARTQRVPPQKDDKILTDWNGLMIAALAKAGRAFGIPEYTRAAQNAAEFLLTHLRSNDGGIRHRYRNGKAGITGHLDDYACLIWGLLELYETDFDPRYLKAAVAFNDYLMLHFEDKKSGGFFFTTDQQAATLVRYKDVQDAAVPSGNSIAMMNLLRLSRITANPELEETARRLSGAFTAVLQPSPSSSTYFLCTLEFIWGPSFEVVISGDLHAADTQAMLAVLGSQFLPNSVVIHRPTDESASAISKLIPYTADQVPLDGKATAYVCRNFACRRPTTDIQRMLELLH